MTFYEASIFMEKMNTFKWKNFYNERLPYPTKTVQLQNDTIEVYIIPDEKKAEVLKKLYPFTPVPSLEDEMLDVSDDASDHLQPYFAGWIAIEEFPQLIANIFGTMRTGLKFSLPCTFPNLTSEAS